MSNTATPSARCEAPEPPTIDCPDPSCPTRYAAPRDAAVGTHARCPVCRLPVILRGDGYVPAPDAAPTEAA